MKKFAFSLLLACGLLASAETNLPTITVTAASQATDHSSVEDVLHVEPGVLLSSQNGARSDLSIRGSSFSGAGISLGGIKLSNPQTEHLSTDLPLPAAILSRPSVRTGLKNQGGHLAGSVGFDLLPLALKRQLELGVGTNQSDTQSLLVQQPLSEQLGVGVFVGREQADRGLDFDDNDSERKYLGGRLQFLREDTQVDLLLSHQRKDFGARGFYGVSPRLPARETSEDTLLLLSARRGDLHTDYLRAGLAWRDYRDDYQLPSINYRNRHRSRVSSAFIDGRSIEINGWALEWRGDAEEERIASRGSSGLGFHHRTRVGASLLPQWRGDRLRITVGARGEEYTDSPSKILPQLGAEYSLTDDLAAFASYSESVRLPSYTELFYISPASQGNSALQAQTAAQTEVGLKGIPSEDMDWEIALFHRREKNAIDWTRTGPTSRWLASDIGTLDTYGAESRLGWYPSQNLEAQLTYSWIYKDREPSDIEVAANTVGYASRYTLDYPEHLLQASLLWRPVQAVEIGTVQAVRLQTDNPARTSSDVGLDSSFVVRYTPPRANCATISMRLNNAWDDDFEMFPGQRASKRYADLSLTIRW